jgi:nitroreductase
MSDIYQLRYLNHQAKKKAMLESAYKEKHIRQKKNPKFWDVIEHRQSTRIFSGERVNEKDLEKLRNSCGLVPSSCNRFGVSVVEISDRKNKSLLSGKLVGGVGWVHRAEIIALLIADMNAYKSPNERDFMPYLDAGVLAEHIMLTAESLNIASCFINPNLNEPLQLQDNERFCGAVALGRYKNDK